MKLKKSIEKAKQQRQELERIAPDREISGEKMNQSVSKTTSPSDDWNSPVYHESCSIRLDPKQLARNRCVSLLPDAQEAEYYKVLRTNIQQRAEEKNWKPSTFFLIDCKHVDMKRFWEDLISLKETAPCECRIALCNADPQSDVPKMAMNNEVEGVFF